MGGEEQDSGTRGEKNWKKKKNQAKAPKRPQYAVVGRHYLTRVSDKQAGRE